MGAKFAPTKKLFLILTSKCREGWLIHTQIFLYNEEVKTGFPTTKNINEVLI